MKTKNSDIEFIQAYEKSESIRQLLHFLGLKEAGGNYKFAKLRIKRLGLNKENFGNTKLRQGWAKGKKFTDRKKISLSEILIKDSYYNSHRLKKRLIEENYFEHKCNKCLLSKWNELLIPLELEHKNGNNQDNRLENLELLCPNCHAQTQTYRGKNKKHM